MGVRHGGLDVDCRVLIHKANMKALTSKVIGKNGVILIFEVRKRIEETYLADDELEFCFCYSSWERCFAQMMPVQLMWIMYTQ